MKELASFNETLSCYWSSKTAVKKTGGNVITFYVRNFEIYLMAFT